MSQRWSTSLAEVVRVEVGRLLCHVELREHLLGRDEPAATHAGRQHLRERAREQGPARKVGPDRPPWPAVEEELAERVVLVEESIRSAEEVGDGPPRPVGVRKPGRVLRVRDRVEELGMVMAQGPLERWEVRSVLGDGNCREPRFVQAECLDSTEVAGRLDRDGVAGVDEALRNEVEALLRPVHDLDVLGGHVEADAAPVTCGDELAERTVPVGGRVPGGPRDPRRRARRLRPPQSRPRRGLRTKAGPPRTRSRTGRPRRRRACRGTTAGPRPFDGRSGTGALSRRSVVSRRR